ncbi:hypothetical protein Ahos_2052 [Acidianus hospitalis W1]|uniref:Uncharacterized protein n=1 Tax=Acidianus hospitalis (strain W1) TaxID=933801 RepID=F4B8H1_ACIHW|nr:hypothetical protein [Acidianus hospitalis]AEE94923.1 hypothetical protein Ahos_2052 [Acidianus hospitalis W1]
MLDFEDIKIDIEDEKTREEILNFFSIFVYLSNFYEKNCIIHVHCNGVQIEGKPGFIIVSNFPKIYSKGADKLRALAYLSLFREETPIVENDIQAISSISLVPLYFSVKMKEKGIIKFLSSLTQYYSTIYNQLKNEKIREDFWKVLNSFKVIDTTFLENIKNSYLTHLELYAKLLAFASGSSLSYNDLLKKYGIIS